MNIKELMQNKTVFYSVIGGTGAVLIIVILLISFAVSGKSSTGTGQVADKIQKESFDIVTTDNQGKAIEIQTLLARHQIIAKRRVDGSKITVFLEGGMYTNTQRDSALLEIV